MFVEIVYNSSTTMEDPVPETIAQLKSWIKNTHVMKFTNRSGNEKKLTKPFHIYKAFYEDHRELFKTAWEYEPEADKPPGQVGTVYKSFLNDVLPTALSQLRAEMEGTECEPTRYLTKKNVNLENGQSAVRAVIGWETRLENLDKYREQRAAGRMYKCSKCGMPKKGHVCKA